MRDAFGGLMNMVIIIVFMVIVSGYMAFNVAYSKAFKVKNKIISTYEEFEGIGCDAGHSSDPTSCAAQIEDYINKIGYNADNMSTSDISPTLASGITEWKCGTKGYCVGEMTIVNDLDGSGYYASKQYKMFRVVTQVNIDIPIINKVMSNLRIFKITGDTKKILIKTTS